MNRRSTRQCRPLDSHRVLRNHLQYSCVTGAGYILRQLTLEEPRNITSIVDAALQLGGLAKIIDTDLTGGHFVSVSH